MVTDPWSLYWQGDNLQSCVASQSASDSEQLAEYWQNIASKLDGSARVLDLACGNGVVAVHLLQASPGMQICGVDQAKIAPQKLIAANPELGSVEFFPETSVSELPFDGESFDLVVSQFGIEYAELSSSSAEAVRVLRPSGVLTFLLHHQDSSIVQSALRHLQEVSQLLAHDGLVERARDYCAGRISLSELERCGEEYLGSATYQTKQVSGQIFAGINHFIELVGSVDAKASDQATQLLATMARRLKADQQRLQQMAAAALDVPGLSAWVERYAELGIDMLETEPLKIGCEEEEILIAWRLSGRKSGD